MTLNYAFPFDSTDKLIFLWNTINSHVIIFY